MNEQEQISENDFQEKCGDFVAREVMCNQNLLIQMLLTKGFEDKDVSDAGYTIDDIENGFIYICPGCGYEAKEDGEECPDCDHVHCDSELQEIFEWWLVTEWLYNKLRDEGEPVLDADGGYYWGRTCTGQAIKMDGVIRNLVKEYRL